MTPKKMKPPADIGNPISPAPAMEAEPVAKIDRLSGPHTHICWTPDGKPPAERELVCLVRASDLDTLERLARPQDAKPAAGMNDTCPFCGKPKHKITPMGFWTPEGYSPRGVRFVCSGLYENPPAPCPGSDVFYGEGAEEQALTAWRTRAHPQDAESLREEVERLRAAEQFTISDGGRLLRKSDVAGVCVDPNLCFERADDVARCAPCAIKLASAAGVEMRIGECIPQVLKLTRELKAMTGERDAALARVAEAEGGDTFQLRVDPWMQACFGEQISADRLERGDRLLEEVLELLQSGDYPQDRVAALTGYVWSRDIGEPAQEVGGVMVTLAAYCLAHGIDMHDAGETELARIWTKVEKIRAKQAAKPTGSALPQAWPAPVVGEGGEG